MQEEEKVAGFAEKISSKWQFLLDKSSPHILVRWITFLVSLYLYLLRVYLVDGWYIVTYGLGIFLLSQSIGFLSPQVKNVSHPTVEYHES
jgi:Rer1 family